MIKTASNSKLDKCLVMTTKVTAYVAQTPEGLALIVNIRGFSF